LRLLAGGIEPGTPTLRALYSTADKGGTMNIRTCLRAGVAATGAAVVGIAAMTASPVASAAQPQSNRPSFPAVAAMGP
jgi:hypothetical protein